MDLLLFFVNFDTCVAERYWSLVYHHMQNLYAIVYRLMDSALYIGSDYQLVSDMQKRAKKEC